MVNVILDAKNQSFKLCAVDGVDVVGFIKVTGYCANLSGSSSEILQDNTLKIITVKNSVFVYTFLFHYGKRPAKLI